MSSLKFIHIPAVLKHILLLSCTWLAFFCFFTLTCRPASNIMSTSALYVTDPDTYSKVLTSESTWHSLNNNPFQKYSDFEKSVRCAAGSNYDVTVSAYIPYQYADRSDAILQNILDTANGKYRSLTSGAVNIESAPVTIYPKYTPFSAIVMASFSTVFIFLIYQIHSFVMKEAEDTEENEAEASST